MSKCLFVLTRKDGFIEDKVEVGGVEPPLVGMSVETRGENGDDFFRVRSVQLVINRVMETEFGAAAWYWVLLERET